MHESASTADEHHPRGGNQLLARLPSDVRERLLRDLDPVRLGFKEVLHEVHQPILYVHFPIDGVLSLLTVLEEGGPVEVATVGNEGLLGLPVFLDAESTPGRAICQVPGEALRMRAERFRRHVERERDLRDLLLHYTQARLTLVAQSAACNRVHGVGARLARWLLMTHDRVGRDEFPLTQEFMGQMLGVRRATVNTAATLLQRAGCIRYHRGRIVVADRRGLEAAACECYGAIRREFDRLLS